MSKQVGTKIFMWLDKCGISRATMNKKNLPFDSLTAITPLDGRYRERIEELSAFVSEFALIETRIEIEVKYLLALSDAGVTRKFTSQEKRKLETLADSLTFEAIAKVK